MTARLAVGVLVLAPACWSATAPAPDAPIPPARRDAPMRACPAGMVHVPAGTFTMGHDSPDKFAYASPAHAVTLDAYCIDRTEVTVAAYERCVEKRGCGPAPTTIDNLPGNPIYPDPGLCNGGKPELSEHPINCVTWHDAAAYCRWAGKELPTEAQWERAARGDDGRSFPWGDDPPINDRGRPRVEERLNFAARDFIKGVSATVPVGHYAKGASPYGVQDMAGNVSEWTADIIAFYGSEPETNPTGPTDPLAPPWSERFRQRFGSDPSYSPTAFRVVRGGGMGFTDAKEYLTYARGTGLHPAWRDYDLGFRCAAAAR